MTHRRFNTVKKDRLFYDRYEYCMGFYLDEASCLRVLDHDHIDDFINRRRQWQEIAQQRWVNGGQRHGIIIGRRWRAITEKTVADLHSLTRVLLASQADFKLVVSVHQGYVYTNDFGLIDQLDQMPELTYKTFSQAKVTRPKNTVFLKKSNHRYRTYLKLLKLNAQQKDNLTDFFANQKSHVRLSPALQQWMDQPFNRTHDYFFIDHDTDTWLTMLSLVQPGIIRKTMHIITAK